MQWAHDRHRHDLCPFCRAYSYRREFLSFDGFDNYFITNAVNKMDTKRQLRKLPTIFPLVKDEQYRYVNARKLLHSLCVVFTVQTGDQRMLC